MSNQTHQCSQCGVGATAEARFCSRCGAPLVIAEQGREIRRNVAILFIDLVGATTLGEQLDPEPLRQLLDEYYGVCSVSIVEHGGVVEKYIGDAVMAVFGVPFGNEDDAVRAVRAADMAMKQIGELETAWKVSDVRLVAHCGVACGEAVVITEARQGIRVIGDVVNTASRLQTAAGPGEILMSDEVAHLIRSQVSMDAVTPLRLKGKSSLVTAWRMAGWRSPVQGDELAPMVGREDELRLIEQTFERVISAGRCCLLTVLGVPGIGKSRLVREVCQRLAEREVMIMNAACPSYDRGLTYRPIAELVRSLPRGWGQVEAVLTATPQHERASWVLRAAGQGMRDEQGVEPGIEETSWALRCLVETLARKRPLAVVIDDLQWATPTLLDLLTEIAEWIDDVPVLIVCVSRPELLDVRPSWGGGLVSNVTLELGPLSDLQTRELVAHLTAQGDVAGQVMNAPAVAATLDDVVARCAGNPLFAELILDHLAHTGVDATIPATVRALLGARVDRLPDEEREILERAATIGGRFTERELAALAIAGGSEMLSILRRLARRRWIRRRESTDQYQFTQEMARETIYAATRKETRARWHLVLADWLIESDVAEADDLPRHLEAAYRLRSEIQPGNPDLPLLARRAARALIEEGERALRRKDLPAALALLERGQKLLPALDPIHRSLALHICDAWIGQGDAQRAQDALNRAEESMPGDLRTARACRIQRQILGARQGSQSPPEIGDLAEDPEDHLSWCRFHQLQAFHNLTCGRGMAAEAAAREAIGRAQIVGDRYEENRAMGALCELAQWSPTSVNEGLSLCERFADRVAADRALLVPVILTRARLSALKGDLEAARTELASAKDHIAALHLELADAGLAQAAGVVETLSGRHDAAAEHFIRGAALLSRFDNPAHALTLEVYACRALLRQGRLDEAGERMGPLRQRAAELEFGAEMNLALIVAAVHSNRGAHESALAEVRSALRMIERTDDPCLIGDAFFDAARVMAAAGEGNAARSAASTAADSYEAKGAVLPALSVREWLRERECDE